MFFILRCCFWLGLVFYMMPWTAPHEAFADLGGRAALTALIQASNVASEYCLAQPNSCGDVAGHIRLVSDPVTATKKIAKDKRKDAGAGAGQNAPVPRGKGPLSGV